MLEGEEKFGGNRYLCISVERSDLFLFVLLEHLHSLSQSMVWGMIEDESTVNEIPQMN